MSETYNAAPSGTWGSMSLYSNQSTDLPFKGALPQQTPATQSGYNVYSWDSIPNYGENWWNSSPFAQYVDQSSYTGPYTPPSNDYTLKGNFGTFMQKDKQDSPGGFGNFLRKDNQAASGGFGTSLQQNTLTLKTPQNNANIQALGLQTGLQTRDSSNYMIATKGQDLVNQAIANITSSTNQNSTKPTKINLTDPNTINKSFDWNTAFDAVNKIGESVGGKEGAVISGAGKIAQSSKSLADAVKNGASGAAKGGGIAGIVGAASDMVGTFMPEKTEYSGDKGNITQTMDSVYDGISDAAMSFGPIGMAVGGIMKGGKFLGQGVNALGGGTSGMTTTDAVLGSSFFNLTPLGLINGFGGKTTSSITKDEDALSQVGGSYTGSESSIDDAVSKSNKKYGLLSRHAFNKAQDQIQEAHRQQGIIQDIAQDTTTRNTLQQSMTGINNVKRQMQLNGGYNQGAISVGKQGMPLQKQPTRINLVVPDLEEIPEFQNGGSMNLIPEGSLHARKHHMEDADNLTKKGIPVVDNEGKQQAEIELNEIIFRLEVTQKLEALMKKYYDEDASQADKDKYALKAGELLVEEILHNTEDRTGLVDTLKQGGVLSVQKEVQNPEQDEIIKMVKQALINILVK